MIKPTREVLDVVLNEDTHDWIEARLLELGKLKYGAEAYTVNDLEFYDGEIHCYVEDSYESIGRLEVTIDDLLDSDAAIAKWHADEIARKERERLDRIASDKREREYREDSELREYRRLKVKFG